MGRIVHVSDLHFGRASKSKVSVLLSQVNGDLPDLVAISGGLTQRAREPEFKAARAFLAGLRSPYLAVPGSHDMPLWRPWARFTRPWQCWRRYITDVETPRWIGPDFIAVGVNTARRWGSWVDWSRGRINRIQVAEAVQIFSRARPGATRVLVAHHPFLLNRANWNRGLVGRAETGLEGLIGANLDLILGGHLHQGYVGVTRVGGVGGPIVAQAATAVSERLRGESNGYNRIHTELGRLEIEVLQWSKEELHIARRYQYRRSALGWEPA
jgi:3',5'-cyclic AMP phosphodiesterase CpdA